MKKTQLRRTQWHRKPPQTHQDEPGQEIKLKARKGLKRRQKRSNLAILRDKAWDTFSLWIRDRDKRCVTCGSYSDLQAGHFWHNCLDFDEININAQCVQCNYYKSGNLAAYSAYLIYKYGVDEFNKLEVRHYLSMKGEYRTEEDYRKIIEKYQ